MHIITTFPQAMSWVKIRWRIVRNGKYNIKNKTLLENWKKKLWNMKVIVIGAFGTVIQGLVQGVEDLEIRGWVETIQTTTLLRSARILKSLGDLRELAVTQTPVENNQLTPWKIVKSIIIMIPPFDGFK